MNVFEAHITLTHSKDFESARLIGEDYGFHFSCIDGDEFMGSGARGYLTKSIGSFEELRQAVHSLIIVLSNRNIEYARYKLECTLIDVRMK